MNLSTFSSLKQLITNEIGIVYTILSILELIYTTFQQSYPQVFERIEGRLLIQRKELERIRNIVDISIKDIEALGSQSEFSGTRKIIATAMNAARELERNLFIQSTLFMDVEYEQSSNLITETSYIGLQNLAKRLEQMLAGYVKDLKRHKYPLESGTFNPEEVEQEE